MHLVILFAVQYVVSPAAEIRAVNVACLVFLFPAHVPLEFGAGGGFLSVQHKTADFAIRLEPSLPNRCSFLADVLVLKMMKTIFKKSFPLPAFSSTLVEHIFQPSLVKSLFHVVVAMVYFLT